VAGWKFHPLTCGSGKPNRQVWIFKRTPACGESCPSSEGLFEFRNYNQYVVGPGSELADGRVYRWFDDVPIIEIPDWLVDVIRQLKADGKQGQERVIHSPGARVSVGQRHNLLKAQGGKLCAAGIGLEALKTEFLRLNHDVFEEPKPDHLILKQAEDMHARWREELHVIISDDDDDDTGDAGVGRLLSEVKAEDVKWVWEPYVPVGMLTMLTGDPGAGKSYIALELTARLSLMGRSTVYLTIENSPSYVLRPRFDALGGDPSHLFLLEGVNAGDGTVRSVQLQDVRILEKRIVKHDACLVVVDPIQSYLGAGVDAHRANETRPIMDALVRMAERTGVAVLIVRHGSKNGSGRALYKGQGSIDFTAAVRSELMAGETTAGMKALVHIKAGVGPLGRSQGYEISGVTPLGAIAKAGYFHYTGDSDIKSDDIMEVVKPDRAKDRAVEFLREALADGPRLATDITEEAEQSGISDRTLRPARETLRIKPYRITVPGPWNWALRSQDVLSKEIGHLGKPQHTNSLTTTYLAQDGQDGQVIPSGHVVGQVGILSNEDRKTPPSDPGEFTLTPGVTFPKSHPRKGSRWEEEDEEIA
jgi:hypothetical protein